MPMLSSLLPNSLGFTRLTRCALTTIRVGKIRLPLVHRLATNVSSCGLGSVIPQIISQTIIGSGQVLSACYTHSSAPFFQIQMYPTTRMARKINISISPNMPRALKRTAQGNRKMVSTSKTTNRIATM